MCGCLPPKEETKDGNSDGAPLVAVKQLLIQPFLMLVSAKLSA